MEQEKAKEAQSILNKIDLVKKRIEWLSDKRRVLCFGTTSSRVNPSVYHSDNIDYQETLDKHHKMIIKELEDEVKCLEKQVADL